MEFLFEYGLFLAKAVTIVVAIALIVGVIVSAGQKKQHAASGHINLTDLTDEYEQLEEGLREETLSKEAFKAYQKAQKKKEKEKAKQEKQALKEKGKKAKEDEQDHNENSEQGVESDFEPHLYVIDFDGDMQASAVENLREEISAILSIATEVDEVLVRLTSPGGMVHSYGLAASQLQRVRAANIKLTIAVDEVAASGGYMMACVANHIASAPFAIIGSIGVLGQIPNFNRLLKHHNIDFEQHTAGEFKRTLTMLGENTDKAREKFKEELEQTHQLFKRFINQNRPELDLEKVATGEHWYGIEALELGLIDSISTSDDLIMAAVKEKAVYKVKYEIKKPLAERLPISVFAALENRLLNLVQKVNLFKSVH